MTLYDLISGFVLIAGGSYAFLAGTGRVEIKPGDSAKSQEWREKYGRFMTIAGPVVVLIGIAHLLGFM